MGDVMCFIKNKWTKFTPTQEYLDAVKGLTSVAKLHNYLQRYKYIAEKGDHWKTPIEFLNDGGGDCEDFAKFVIDVLVRIQKLKEARFIAYYTSKEGHAICVFPYRNSYSIFSNNQLIHGFADYLDIGHFFFKDIKRMVVRDWQGKVIEKKHKWIGTF